MAPFTFLSNASSKALDKLRADSAPKSTESEKPIVEEQPSSPQVQPTDLASSSSLPTEDTPISPSSPTNPAKRSFNLFRVQEKQHKPVISTEQEQRKERRVVQDFKHAVLVSTNPDKRAQESAEIARALIIGPNSITLAQKKHKPLSKAQVDKVKSQLGKPTSANRVIAKLRQLDAESEPPTDPKSDAKPAKPRSKGPIQAVCLDTNEEEATTKHFKRLKPDAVVDSADNVEATPSVVNASLESMSSLFSDLSVVSLLSSDFGIGQSADKPGLLAGAVPTAETIMAGIQTITPQIMSLGYATNQAIMPDHQGLHPPTDRISVLTYWWGLEVLMPSPTLHYLSNAQSVSHACLNFLTALGAVHNGVREILPFVRYISQFIEFEFNNIKGQDKGQGVVCAATWIMPAAMVPRPWDFEAAPTADPEPETTPPAEGAEPVTPPVDQPVLIIQPTDPNPAPTTPSPEHPDPQVPRPVMGALPPIIAPV